MAHTDCEESPWLVHSSPLSLSLQGSASPLRGAPQHLTPLTRQLERMGYEVPDNPYLGEVSAPADLQTAAEAWAVGEVANVEIYDELLTQTEDRTLIRVL